MTHDATQVLESDIAHIRRGARADIGQGAVTPGYSANRGEVVRILNGALATELVCMMRYRRHHFMARGLAARSAAEEFLTHAGQELAHVDQLAARIVQLNGEPNFNPSGLAERSSAEYVEGVTLVDMIRENLVAERIAIDSYRAMISFLSTDDPTTRRLLESILAVEEEHADDMADLLRDHQPAEVEAAPPLEATSTLEATPTLSTATAEVAVAATNTAPVTSDTDRHRDLGLEDPAASTALPGGRVR